MIASPKTHEIWLVQFPFSDLTATKLRPALVLANYQEELIILGIFSKIPSGKWQEAWVLVEDTNPNFSLTGLKKTSIIRADKIATVNKSVFRQKLGTLPTEMPDGVTKRLKAIKNRELTKYVVKKNRSF